MARAALELLPGFAGHLPDDVFPAQKSSSFRKLKLYVRSLGRSQINY